MKKVTIYSTMYCPYCTRVKQLFDKKGVAFEEVDLSTNFEELEALKERTNWQTVPQVFVGEEFIGGFDETNALDRNGELDALLAD